MTIAEAVTNFLRNRRTRNCRIGTIETYSRTLGYFATFIRERGVVFARDLSVPVIEEYLSHRMNQGLKPSTVKNERAIVIMFCDHLARAKIVPKEEWHDVLDIKQDNSPPKVLPDELCRNMIETVNYVLFYRVPMLRKRDLAILGILFDAGLRASEVVRLNLEDLNLGNRSIHINEECKSRRPRTVFVSDITIKYLKRYLEMRTRYAKRTNALFVTRHGSRMKYSTLYCFVVRVARMCGSHATPHQLRHTNATTLINNGLNVSDVRILLGHSNIATTMKYVHLASEDVRKRYLEVAPLDRLMEST